MIKHLRYLKYLICHKFYVGVECWKVGLYWQGIVHDWSKFLPDEWFPYVHTFYGSKKEQELYKQKYKEAWLKHQHRNPHHWQYWVLNNDDSTIEALPIPHKYKLEMICDWIGAGKAQGKSSPTDDTFKECREWYQSNSTKMILHGSVRTFVRRFFSKQWNKG